VKSYNHSFQLLCSTPVFEQCPDYWLDTCDLIHNALYPSAQLEACLLRDATLATVAWKSGFLEHAAANPATSLCRSLASFWKGRYVVDDAFSLPGPSLGCASCRCHSHIRLLSAVQQMVSESGKDIMEFVQVLEGPFFNAASHLGRFIGYRLVCQQISITRWVCEQCRSNS